MNHLDVCHHFKDSHLILNSGIIAHEISTAEMIKGLIFEQIVLNSFKDLTAWNSKIDSASQKVSILI